MLNHKKATIKDVALAAGVSTQTVSRILNNRLDVSPGTRQRILEIIADVLNFTQTWVSFGLPVEQVSVGEIRTAIENALANGALSQEKAAWLLEGFEKGFVTVRRFLQK
jgi:transcriptional regulator with XRE-family HTH domain